MVNKKALKVFKYIVQSAPASQLSLVLEDVLKLGDDSKFFERKEIIDAIRDYYLTHLTHFQVDGDKRVSGCCLRKVLAHLIAEESKEEVKEGAEGENKGEEEEKKQADQLVFIDTVRKVKFRVDVRTGKAEIIDTNVSIDLPEQLLVFKESLEGAAEKYIAKRYRENTTLAAASLKINESGKIELQLNISCHNVNLGNFWAGEWLSKWHIVISKNGSATLDGSININDHYFESGNIQFKLEKAFENIALTLDIQDSESVAETIIKTVEKLEDQYQYSLDVMYETVSEEFLKTMRRKLPKTGVKFNWAPKLI